MTLKQFYELIEKEIFILKIEWSKNDFYHYQQNIKHVRKKLKNLKIFKKRISIIWVEFQNEQIC